MSIYYNAKWDHKDAKGLPIVNSKQVYADIRPIPLRHNIPEVPDIWVPYVVNERRIQARSQNVCNPDPRATETSAEEAVAW